MNDKILNTASITDILTTASLKQDGKFIYPFKRMYEGVRGVAIYSKGLSVDRNLITQEQWFFFTHG